MTIHATGGCACGAIRYECSAAAAFAGNCHCRDCQRATGSAFAPLVFVPKSAVTITGDVKYYDVKGDSGQIVSRGFCPACGTRLFLNPAMMSDVPTMDIYTASAQPWDCMNPDLTTFPKMPSV